MIVFKRRRIVLKKRVSKLKIRRRSLKRRIGHLQSRRVRLTLRVKRLRLQRSILKHRAVLPASALKSVKSVVVKQLQVQKRAVRKVRRITTRIRENLHRIAVCSGRIRTLKIRRIDLKARIKKVSLRNKRLVHRIALVKRRIHRQVKRVTKLIAVERKIVHRATKTGVVPRRILHRIVKKTTKVVAKVGGQKLLSKLVSGPSVRPAKKTTKRVSIAGIRVVLPSVPKRRIPHVPGINRQATVLKKVREKLRVEKKIITKKLNVKKAVKKILSHQPRLHIRAPINQIIGGKRVLKPSKTEKFASKILKSRKKISVQKIKYLQERLRKKLLLLRKKLKISGPAFDNLVKQSKTILQNGLEQASEELDESASQTTDIFKHIISKQKWLYNTEFKTFVTEAFQTVDGGTVTLDGPETTETQVITENLPTETKVIDGGVTTITEGDKPGGPIPVGIPGKTKVVRTVNPDGSISWTETSATQVISDPATTVTQTVGGSGDAGWSAWKTVQGGAAGGSGSWTTTSHRGGSTSRVIVTSTGGPARGKKMVKTVNPDGSISWTETSSSEVINDPASTSTQVISDGAQLIGGKGGKRKLVKRVNPDGSISWTESSSSEVINGPVTTQVISGPAITSSQVISDGSTLIGGQGGKRKMVKTVNPDGSISWTESSSSEVISGGPVTTSTQVITDGGAAKVTGSTGGKMKMVKTVNPDGSISWTESSSSEVVSGGPVTTTTRVIRSPVTTHVITEGGAANFVGSTGGSTNKVKTVNPDGSITWTESSSSQVIGGPVTTSSQVISGPVTTSVITDGGAAKLSGSAGGNSKMVKTVNPDGSISWTESSSSSQVINGPVTTSSQVISGPVTTSTQVITDGAASKAASGSTGGSSNVVKTVNPDGSTSFSETSSVVSGPVTTTDSGWTSWKTT